jgi:hypothetical protein
MFGTETFIARLPLLFEEEALMVAVLTTSAEERATTRKC